MLVGEFEQLIKYISLREFEQLKQLIDAYNGGNEVKLNEWFKINGSNLKAIWLNKSNYNVNVFESHKLNQDIHVIVKGCDKIMLGDPMKCQEELIYQVEGDYALFKSENLIVNYLIAGSVAVIEPEELHSNLIEDLDTLKLVIKKKIKHE